MQGNVVSSWAVLPVTVKVGPATATATRRRSTIKMRVRAGAGAGATAAEVEVDYSSNVSVFPMEACELVGGEACEAHMYPEVKPTAGGTRGRMAVAEEVEREYLPYDDQKTVFPGEACDDLGGEFCEAPYQMGVSKED